MKRIQIELTAKEHNAVLYSKSIHAQYYCWCGILFLRGMAVPKELDMLKPSIVRVNGTKSTYEINAYSLDGL